MVLGEVRKCSREMTNEVSGLELGLLFGEVWEGIEVKKMKRRKTANRERVKRNIGDLVFVLPEDEEERYLPAIGLSRSLLRL